MDDMQAIEQRVTRELLRRAGPSETVNDAAIFTAITATQSPKWRFQSMFSATRFIVAGAIVALFGGFLLSGVLTQPAREVPAAEAPGLGVAVSGTMGDPWDSPNPRNVYEGDGFAAGTYVLDGLPVDFDDDRLDGTMTGSVEMAFYDPELAVISGPITITNENGAWDGVIKGAGVTADDWHLLISLDGSGAYAGLSTTLIPGSDGSGAMTGVIYSPDDLDPSQRPEAVAGTQS